MAAGEGKRMQPLTFTKPKPLLEVAGRPLIDHIVDVLPKEITDLFIVVGYKKEQIIAHCGEHFKGRRVQYVHQEKPLGTRHALELCKPYLTGRFLVILGDDFHGTEALAEALTFPRTLMVSESEHPERFGDVSVNKDGTLESLIEKPEKPLSNLVSTGVMVLDTHIFYFEADNSKKELYLPDAVAKYAKHYPMQVIRQPRWFAIGYPEDLAKAEEWLEQ